jgi:hypothetical protein
MLIKIGETQWIKAKKINAVQLCKKTGETWGIRVYTGACIFDHSTHANKEEALRQLDYLALTINSKNK